uniref:Uncharacterized protein n=3 Tax=unclassified Kayfunavirus TaxID=2749939 RepID=A0AAU8GEJ6_9CAUD
MNRYHDCVNYTERPESIRESRPTRPTDFQQ